MMIMHPVRDLTGSRSAGVPAVAEDKPHPSGISLGNSCNLQAALAGLLENESPGAIVFHHLPNDDIFLDIDTEKDYESMLRKFQ